METLEHLRTVGVGMVGGPERLDVHNMGVDEALPARICVESGTWPAAGCACCQSGIAAPVS